MYRKIELLTASSPEIMKGEFMINIFKNNVDSYFVASEFFYDRHAYLLEVVENFSLDTPENVFIDKHPVLKSLLLKIHLVKGLGFSMLFFLLACIFLIFSPFDFRFIYKIFIILLPSILSFFVASLLFSVRNKSILVNKKAQLLSNCVSRFEYLDRSISHSISDDPNLCEKVLIFRGELLIAISTLRENLNREKSDCPMYSFEYSKNSRQQIFLMLISKINESHLKSLNAFKKSEIVNITENSIFLAVKSEEDFLEIQDDFDNIKKIFSSIYHKPVFLPQYSES